MNAYQILHTSSMHDFHAAYMLMIVDCILLSLVAMLSACIALGLAIIANDNNEKDRPSEQD